MKRTRTMSRWAAARRLQELALRIAGGRPLRVGRRATRAGDRVTLEEELEVSDGVVEFELELRWPATPGRRAARAPAPGRRRAR